MDGLRLELEAHSLFQSLFSFVLLSFHSTEWKDARGGKKKTTFQGATESCLLTRMCKFVTQYSMFV